MNSKLCIKLLGGNHTRQRKYGMSRGEFRDDEPWTDERLTGSHRYQSQLYLAYSLKTDVHTLI